MVPERDTPDGPIVYQAESPDEGALVGAAQALGYEFSHRTTETEVVRHDGASLTYEVMID